VPVESYDALRVKIYSNPEVRFTFRMKYVIVAEMDISAVDVSLLLCVMVLSSLSLRVKDL